jgi:hypothetical protein
MDVTIEIDSISVNVSDGIPNIVRTSPNQESRPVLMSHSHPTDFPDSIAMRSRSLEEARSASTLFLFTLCRRSPKIISACAENSKMPAMTYRLYGYPKALSWLSTMLPSGNALSLSPKRRTARPLSTAAM